MNFLYYNNYMAISALNLYKNNPHKIDLHIHSCHSDGSDSIEELMKKIVDSGIGIFALTDHDTIAGCLEIQKIIPKGIIFIPGIELTCKSDNISCHILGYNCDCNNKILRELIEKGKVLRRKKLETRIEYLKNVHNIELTESEKDWLYSRTSVVKTHIANILVKRGLATDNVSAMKIYLDDCKTGNTKFSITEAIHAILSSGGIPVWAHPLGGEGEAHISENDFLSKLQTMLQKGIQGLECYYSRYNSKEAEFLVNCAKKSGLLISGGSDYHGTNKNIPLGRLNCFDKEISPSLITLIK